MSSKQAKPQVALDLEPSDSFDPFEPIAKPVQDEAETNEHFGFSDLESYMDEMDSMISNLNLN